MMFFNALLFFWPVVVLPMFFSAVLGVGFIFTAWPFFGRKDKNKGEIKK